jgi:hypothetical protein
MAPAARIFSTEQNLKMPPRMEGLAMVIVRRITLSTRGPETVQSECVLSAAHTCFRTLPGAATLGKPHMSSYISLVVLIEQIAEGEQ